MFKLRKFFRVVGIWFMRNVFKLLIVFFVASGSAHAVTITQPESSVCLGLDNAGCDTSNLQPGNTYLLTSDRFEDALGNPYDVAVTVLLKTIPDPETITAFGQIRTGGFVQYNIRFVERVDDPLSVGADDLTLFQPEDTVFRASFEDIDSNDNSKGDFSEFVGVDLRDNIASGGFTVGDALTTGQSGGGADGTASLDTDLARALTQSDQTPLAVVYSPVDAGEAFSQDLQDAAYQFAYAKKIGDDPSWLTVPNIRNRVDADGDPTPEGAQYTASFSLGRGPVDFNFVYGVANEGTSRGNTRQFALGMTADFSLDNPGQPVPEIDGPVLVQVGFALAGLYVLMLGRRRSGENMEMVQAAA